MLEVNERESNCEVAVQYNEQYNHIDATTQDDHRF